MYLGRTGEVLQQTGNTPSRNKEQGTDKDQSPKHPDSEFEKAISTKKGPLCDGAPGAG